MGVKDLKAAFNEVATPAASASVALLEYEQHSETEWQVLFFSGNYADGTGFSIKSNRIRPGGDVNAIARATAQTLLQRKRV